MSSELRCWYAAVDWASEKHDIVVTDCEGKRLGRLQVEHSGEGLARMSDWLIATAGGTPDEIHIAIEVPHGPIVDTLIERGFKMYSTRQAARERGEGAYRGHNTSTRWCNFRR